MGLPSPGPRDAPGTAAFPTLTGLGSARCPRLPAKNQPRGSETPPTRPKTGLLQVTLQTGHGRATAGRPALALRAEKEGIGGGGYRRQRGADTRATGRSHTQEGEGSTLWRQAGGSPEPTLPHPSPDARGCLLYVATDDRGGGQDTVTGASIQLKDWDSGFSPRFKHVTLQFHRCLKMPPGHRRTRKQAFRGQHHQERLGRILKYDFKQI